MNNLAISIDTETLGIKDDAPVVQIGAALFDILDPPGTVLQTLEFVVDHGPRLQNVEPYAAAMNWKILAALGGYTVDDPIECPIILLEDAAEHLGDWIRCYWPEGKVVFAGKNFTGFDRPKLERLPGWFQNIPKYHHRSPDPGSMYWRPEVDGTELPSTDVCMERAGLGGVVAHTAEQDAIVVATLIQTWVQDDSRST
jgi:hypothetical protein